MTVSVDMYAGVGKAQIWDITSGEVISEPIRADSVQFSPDGQRFTTVTGNMAQLWDASSCKPIGEPMNENGTPAFSLNGQRRKHGAALGC